MAVPEVDSELISVLTDRLAVLLTLSPSVIEHRSGPLRGIAKASSVAYRGAHSICWKVVLLDDSELCLHWRDYRTGEAKGLSHIRPFADQVGCVPFHWGNKHWVLTEWVPGEHRPKVEKYVRLAIKRLVAIQSVPISEIMQRELPIDRSTGDKSLVLSHGDYCINNMLFSDGDLPVILDWASCALRPRWYDWGYLTSTSSSTGVDLSAYSKSFELYYSLLIESGLDLDRQLALEKSFDYLLIGHVTAGAAEAERAPKALTFLDKLMRSKAQYLEDTDERSS